eukprot:PLAT12530.2.p1 GENE.PLAT12530.2~~PLAT12530.2.p1  ORF type:complete len:322 (+),score=129.91 PLAT12530.2:813-1778(+)
MEGKAEEDALPALLRLPQDVWREIVLLLSAEEAVRLLLVHASLADVIPATLQRLAAGLESAADAAHVARLLPDMRQLQEIELLDWWDWEQDADAIVSSFGELLALLPQLPALRSCCLQLFAVGGRLVKLPNKLYRALAAMPALERLDVVGFSSVCAGRWLVEALADSRSQLRSLSVLVPRKRGDLTDFTKQLRALDTLEELRLVDKFRCGRRLREELATIPAALPALPELCVLEVEGITGVVMEQLVAQLADSHAGQLQELSLAGCSHSERMPGRVAAGLCALHALRSLRLASELCVCVASEASVCVGGCVASEASVCVWV